MHMHNQKEADLYSFRQIDRNSLQSLKNETL